MRQERKKERQIPKKQLKHILGCKKGTTLVELVVTFALIGLFAVGITQTISSALKVYHQIRGLNNAYQVSDTLMDKITGEIEGAQVGVQYEENDNVTLKITTSDEGNSQINLYERTGSKIHITTSGERLVIHYYPVEDSESSDVRYEAVDWKYDAAAYMGFKISSLTFAQADQSKYPPNVIKVDMDLKGDGYGIFHTTRYVECYNFVTDQDFEKIKDEGGQSGGEGDGGDTPDVPGADTYPGTDIEIQSNYWPKQEEWPKDDPWKLFIVKAGGVFLYDGEYYVVTKDVQINKQQAASGPGGMVYGWFNTQKLTGRIVEYAGEEQKNDLIRGDLCFYKGEYYVFDDGGTVADSPGKSTWQWYKIPN